VIRDWRIDSKAPGSLRSVPPAGSMRTTSLDPATEGRGLWVAACTRLMGAADSTMPSRGTSRECPAGQDRRSSIMRCAEPFNPVSRGDRGENIESVGLGTITKAVSPCSESATKAKASAMPTRSRAPRLSLEANRGTAELGNRGSYQESADGAVENLGCDPSAEGVTRTERRTSTSVAYAPWRSPQPERADALSRGDWIAPQGEQCPRRALTHRLASVPGDWHTGSGPGSSALFIGFPCR
jgi:hypothetical protein